MTSHDHESTSGDGAAGDAAEPEESGATHSTSKRWWLTNDGLAWLLVGTFPVVIAATAAGYLDLATVPSEVVYTWLASVGTAVAWAFGKDAIEAWRAGGDG